MLRNANERRDALRACIASAATISAIMAAWLPRPAVAASIEWSGRGTNLSVTTAQRCTLEVAFTPLEQSNLREWRLLWAADGASFQPLRAVPSGSFDGVIEACEVRPDRNAMQLSHVDTAYFCAGTGVPIASQTVRYLFDVSSTTPMRIGVLPILGKDGGPYASMEGIAEATINGGSKAAYPPVLIDISYTNVTNGTIYRASGAFLSDIKEAHISKPQTGAIIPVRVLQSATTFVELQGPMLEQVGVGLLEVRNRRGEWTSIPIDWSASGLKRVEAPRLLVRVERSSLLATPDGASGLSPSLAAALTKAGVVSLHPLFPGASGKGDRSAETNIIGERIEVDPLDDWFVGDLGLDADVAGALKQVRNSLGVREAGEERWGYPAQLTPNDPRFTRQWALVNPGTSICSYSEVYTASIFADQAWNQTTGSPNVRMAILDSGINPFHEDLGGRVQLGPNFVFAGSSADDNGHGTSVAGIATAVGNNNTGIAGVAWQVQPWAVKVLNSHAGGIPSVLSKGIAWADSVGIPILNMSLGWTDPSSDLSLADRSLLATLTLRAMKHGRFLVAASGNALESLGPFSACPADLDKRVYAVGGFLPNGNRWVDDVELGINCNSFPCYMSNYGGFLDAVAPGGRLIVTTGLGNAEYVDLTGCVPGDPTTMGWSGTSAAAPVVSGIAALLLARRPELSGEDIAQVLNRTTGQNFWVHDYGWGRVNAYSALNFVGPSKAIGHWSAGPGPYTLGPLQVMGDSATIPSRQFLDVPGMPSNNYTTRCARYHLKATLAWPFPFASDVKGWIRSSGTLAWKDVNPYYYNEVVDTAAFVGSVGQMGATVEAYVFRVMNAFDTTQTIGWFPTEPAQAQVALTVIGTPAGTAGVGPASIGARLAITTLPNPFRAAVKMTVDVPVQGHVRMTVLDLVGRRIATLAEGDLAAGRHEFWWDGRTQGAGQSPAGVYFCRVDCAGLSTVKRFIRLSENR